MALYPAEPVPLVRILPAVFQDRSISCSAVPARYCLKPQRDARRWPVIPQKRLLSFTRLQRRAGACGFGAFALERECLFDLGDPQADVLIAQFLKENQEINQSHIRFLNEEDASAETARLRGLLGACVNPQQNGRIMDIPPAGMDKAEGVRRMAERYGISQGDIYAAGDQYNDASMVETFHGFAMAHGVDALKIKAESVVKDVAEAVRIILQGPAG